MSTRAGLPEILLVDDEPNVLDALRLRLRRGYRVTVATSGVEGLELMEARSAPFAVVVSDMRMPEMNGAEFLARARVLAPDTTRILLTGHSELDAAIAAVNEGNIFRFLTKPCPPEVLQPALTAAVGQFELVTGQQRLLRDTLAGTIAAMASLLQIAQPTAFTRAARATRLVTELARSCGRTSWELETAAQLSQLGFGILPTGLMDRLAAGAQLEAGERETLATLPGVAAEVLAHVPRLGPVVDILRGTAPDAPNPSWESMALRVALDLEIFERQGLPLEEAITLARAWSGSAARDVLDQYQALQSGPAHTGPPTRDVPTGALDPGMMIAEDVTDSTGRILLASGYRITAALAPRICELLRVAGIHGTVKVHGAMPTAADAGSSDT